MQHHDARVHWTRHGHAPKSSCGLTITARDPTRARERFLLVDAEGDKSLWKGLVLDCQACGEALCRWSLQAANYMRAQGLRISAFDAQLEAARMGSPPNVRYLTTEPPVSVGLPLRRSYPRCPECGSSPVTSWGCEVCIRGGKRVCICPIASALADQCPTCGGLT
jgi:hypothetical protein